MNIQPIFQSFLSTDKHRQWMHQINEHKGYYYATNGHILIRVKADKSDTPYPAHPKTANFDAIFEPLTFHDPVVFTNRDLIECLNRFEKVPERDDCDECYGTGEKECDMGHDHPCNECDGNGYTENSLRLVFPPGEKTFIKMCGSYFSPFNMSILFYTLEGLHKDKFALICSKDQPLKAKVFVIDDFEIMIMPCNWKSVDDKEDAQVVELNPIT